MKIMITKFEKYLNENHSKLMNYELENNLELKNNELIKAIRYNKVDRVQILITMGADVNCNNEQPARVACVAGNLETLKLIYENGKPIDISKKDISRNGVYEPTTHNIMITSACESGKLDIVKFLVEEKRFDPTIKNNYCIKYLVQKLPYYKEVIEYLYGNSDVKKSLDGGMKEKIETILNDKEL